MNFFSEWQELQFPKLRRFPLVKIILTCTWCRKMKFPIKPTVSGNYKKKEKEDTRCPHLVRVVHLMRSTCQTP